MYRVRTEKTFRETKDDLAREFQTWQRDAGCSIEWTLEANVPTNRQFSLLMPSERAVTLTVRFSNGRQFTWAMDDQLCVADNARAMCLAVERLRLIEKAGLSEHMKTALLQLTSGEVDGESAWAILGLAPGAPAADIESAYSRAAKKAHPDLGGSNEEMARVNRAYQQLRALA